MSDQIAVMQSGRIAQMDTPEALYSQPVSAYVADFVGSANLLGVEPVAQSVVSVAGRQLIVDTSDATGSGPRRLVLRSETLGLLPRSQPQPENALPVTLTGRQYLGAKTLCRVALDNDEVLHVDVPGLQSFQPGDALWLQVPSSSRVISQ